MRVIIRMGTADSTRISGVPAHLHVRPARAYGAGARGHEVTWAPLRLHFRVGIAEVAPHTEIFLELHTETPSADGNREGPRLRDHWPGLGSPGSIGRRRHACNHLAGVRRCDQGPTGRPTDCFERACGVGAQSLRVPTRHGLRNSIPLERPEPPPASIWERRPARGVVRH